MALVVQKYGGSSVADADGIKRVAQRIAATRKSGDSVVVAVSAMGDTTDELLDLAAQVSPLPPGRELDMLLTAGERISMALLAMAIANPTAPERLQRQFQEIEIMNLELKQLPNAASAAAPNQAHDDSDQAHHD